MRRRALVLLSLVPGILCAQVTYERLALAAAGTAELADLLRHLHQPALQRARPDHAAQRQERWNRSGSSRPRACRSSRPRRWWSTASCI